MTAGYMTASHEEVTGVLFGRHESAQRALRGNPLVVIRSNNGAESVRALRSPWIVSSFPRLP